jgi:hypothetical protein
LVALAPAGVQRCHCAIVQGQTSMTLAVGRYIFYPARGFIRLS